MTPVELLNHPLFGIVAFLSVVLLIALVNLVALTRLDHAPRIPPGYSAETLPKVSVLVPARNEELNIGHCVESLLNQDYPNYEVLALDDHSTDRTGEILAGLAANDPRLRILAGQPLPQGWIGKNWACHQLAEAAEGDLLLFIDADTAHAPKTLSQSASVLLSKNLGMLTALPRQLVLTWGERLIVPVLYFCLMVFLPLPLAYRLRLPVFSAAIGQFMLFRRSAYDRIGGYAAVRAHGADDLALARQVKTYNLPWRLADGSGHTSTRMYRDFRQAYEGFSKNLFAAFDYRILPFLFAWLWMGYLFFRPPIEMVITALATPENDMLLLLCAVAILESLALWALAVLPFRFPAYLFLCYLPIVFMSVWIALRSVALSLRGQTTWKGRRIERSNIRWI